ncbi:MAG: prepilin-type N-terminal cleavage/methylation domain-containing protein [Planctomycetota bacterium]
MRPAPRATRRRRRSVGLSLVEMLISLTITAMLLTAVMVALDASFQAYAAAAESASTQTTTRLIVHRTLTLVRTSTAHGPLVPDSSTTPPVTLDGIRTINSHYLDLVNPKGDLIRLEYRAAEEMIYVSVTPYGGSVTTTEPLLGGVTACQFVLTRRLDDDGVWVMERGSMDFTVMPDADTSLAIEGDGTPPVRVVASTMPRKLD